jgi:adenosylcobyric acid synthase
MKYGHGGNIRALASQAGCGNRDILDFSASINPLGPPECLRRVISASLEEIVHYPDPRSTALTEAIAALFSLDPNRITAGNGSEELLFALPRAIKATRALIPGPCYVDYEAGALRSGIPVKHIALDPADGFSINWEQLSGDLRDGDMVFLGQPNNPTGRLFDPDRLRNLAGRHPSVLFVVDEAFADFVDSYRSLCYNPSENMIILRSMTKFYAVPGLRLGYAVTSLSAAEMLRAELPPWSVNTLAQAAAKAFLNDKEYAQRTVTETARLRSGLESGLSSLPGLHVFPSAANYLLVRIDRAGMDAHELNRKLLAQGMAIRVCDNFRSLDKSYFRVAVRSVEENEKLLAAMRGAWGVPRKRVTTRRSKKPALMFQGTSSNAGKSVLTAAICRILLQDGLRIAPFKAQNMSLNSHVTPDGGEIGRAQAVQAQACRIDSDVRMNPVLLKPNSETGSQVIVRGRPVGNMTVGEYIRFKAELVKEVRACYDSLSSEYDAIIIEGAGSPGEVNLKSHDIVNMAMARYAEAPVLLVGDIDRGGVFASFVGTMEVLEEWERTLIAGFVVNRFRGDAGLLTPAFDYTLAHTGRPVIGVVPFFENLGLQEEDSVSFKEGATLRRGKAVKNRKLLDVAICDLPHISNFTDFDALKVEDDIAVRIVRRPDELGVPDLLILPGSKNVAGDMDFLRKNGMAERIIGLEEKTTIIGICGGFQILGKEILDPHALESSRKSTPGLGLLHMQTELAEEKTLCRTEGIHTASGCRVFGYEIHHGQSTGEGLSPVVLGNDGLPLAFGISGEQVWGTYMHGIFDADEFRRWLIDTLRSKRGWRPREKVCAVYDVEAALDRLASRVRTALDMKYIYRIMGL